MIARRPLTLFAALTVSLALSDRADAAFPEDINVQGLELLDAATAQQMFDYVSREMAMMISPKALSPGETIGAYGFEMGFENTLAFPHTSAEADSNVPTWDLFTAWDLMTESGAPSRGVVYIPQLRLRKGLPYSLEIGGTLGWIMNTRQTILGGHARWAPLEGWPNVPDVALGWGYTGLIGNETLDIGTFEFDITVGYTFPFGLDRKFTSATFAPFVGLGLLASHARPKNIDFDLLAGTAWSKNADPGVDLNDFRFTKIFVGFTLVNNHFQFAFSGELIPNGVHAINMRVGLSY